MSAGRVKTEFPSPIIGRSTVILQTLADIALVAPTDVTVLIYGETGCGKELVAEALHAQSTRAGRPLVRVNCGAVPGDLFESEFFGHVRGAFTGAHCDRAGHFERAQGGTLFLDEVSEIPTALQGKLLRALQEGEVTRLGDARHLKLDVRIIAASNRVLTDEVHAGRFREDLFFRLNVVPIALAPLRERTEDIALLARHFAEAISVRLGRSTPVIAPDCLEVLRHHDWPGNVRELRNVVERAIVFSNGGPLSFVDALNRGRMRRDSCDGAQRVTSEPQRKQRERLNILAALKQSGGKIYGSDGAAALLGLKPTTLSSRIKSLGIVRCGTATVFSLEDEHVVVD